MITSQLSIWRNNKKILYFLNIFCYLILILWVRGSALASDSECDEILGKWYTDKKEAIFEFFKKEDKYFARLIPLKIPHLRDSLNPVDSLKSRKLHNIIIVKDLICTKEKGVWGEGTIYNPKDGKSYKCICKIIDNRKKLMVKGYLGITILGGTRIFTRE